MVCYLVRRVKLLRSSLKQRRYESLSVSVHSENRSALRVDSVTGLNSLTMQPNLLGVSLSLSCREWII